MQLYYFFDVSEIGYGIVFYLLLENIDGECYCFFIMGKFCVILFKQIIILRLELMVVIIVVKINKMLLIELDMFIDCVIFWIDSMVVLCYIQNRMVRFYIFVVNRLVVIYEGLQLSNWRYINMKVNLVDYVLRGILVNSFIM